MTDYADWEDLHFDALPFDGFEDESDWEYEMQFGNEDAYLDTYWEDMAEIQAGFWGGE